jgi:hypothetical protein
VSLIASWVGFPLLLAAIGLGWGYLVELAAGRSVNNVLVIPVGLAAALVVAGTFTTFSGSAPAAVPVVAVGAGIGLVVLLWTRLRDAPRGLEPEAPPEGQPAAAGESDGADPTERSAAARWRLPGLWPALAAIGALLVYGAPVLLTGHATFTGYVKLDDTATWFNIVDVVMNHSHSLAAMNSAFHPPSTFTQVFTGDVGEHYPLGAFMLLGVGRGLTGIDPAWIIQPYFACCAAALALGIYALVGNLVPSCRLRALVAFVGAQPALLYGYSLWGGIKEMTAAFLLAAGVALVVPLLRRAPTGMRDVRAMVPLAITAGALAQTLQIGAGGWVGPAFLVLALTWLWPKVQLGGAARSGAHRVRASVVALVALGVITAAMIVPIWAALSSFLSNHFTGLFSEGQTHAEQFGNLLQPISGWQLAGIWPVGDFRFTAAAMPTAIFIGVVIAGALFGVVMAILRRGYGPPLYVLVVLCAVALEWALGVTPWVLGKSLAISSPALLTAGLTGAAMLWSLRRGPLPPIAGASQLAPEAAPPAPRGSLGGPSAEDEAAPLVAWLRRHHAWVLGPIVMLIIGVGVLWSNVLAYSDATIAPRARLAELQHVGELVKGKGPTFLNQYEAYGDRHFLREGAPVEPAEYRPVVLPLRNGAVLTKSAWANLDAFPLSTLLPYRSIVTMRAPVESRPPSLWHLVWQGKYYQLWQRPASATSPILEHIPYGEPNEHPYCGNAERGSTEPLCALNPVSVPSCPQIHVFAQRAANEHAHLLAYQRAAPDVVRGDEVRWPAAWLHEPNSHSLLATTPGTAVGGIAIPTTQTYELFLGGSFGRGFEVKVDGHKIATVKDQLTGFLSYIPVAKLHLTRGVHHFEYTYPQADATPGNGETLGTGMWAPAARWTTLNSVVLQPLDYPSSELISVSPAEASRLCGRPLEWVEIVSNS